MKHESKYAVFPNMPEMVRGTHPTGLVVPVTHLGDPTLVVHALLHMPMQGGIRPFGSSTQPSMRNGWVFRVWAIPLQSAVRTDSSQRNGCLRKVTTVKK
ncbi:hypothetical protein VU12_13115 [Desulfobulbus sp. US4]|nr:hypothetical protein [Desulfobulbus sp. US4]